MSTPQSDTIGKFRPGNQSYNNFRRSRPSERRDYSNNNDDRHNGSKARSRYSQAKTNPGTGEVTITIHDRLQRQDKIHPSRISAVNPGQNHLTVQFLTDLGTVSRAKTYQMTRNSQLPMMDISQTWFESLQQTIQLRNYRYYAL